MSKYSTNFGESDLSRGQIRGLAKTVAVRVYDIILDSKHPEYNSMGKELAIGVIRYAPLDRKVDLNQINKLPYAFPSNGNINLLPLVNEIVILDVLPSEKAGDKDRKASKLYYTSIVNIWNNSNNNQLVNELEEKVDTGKFIENNVVKPLSPFPGDLIVQGRYGHSIRMGGTISNNNELSDESNNGKPFTIISNGSTNDDEKVSHVVEDVNLNSNSIYLVSDHIVQLEQARDKTKAWKKPPTKADTYKGSQVMINGGRLYFNSKEESTLFSSKEAFGVTSNTINLDAKEYIALDAEKIYLGEKALVEEFEPVILGESMEGFLYTLLFNLQALADDLVVAGTAGINVQNLITRGKVMKESLKNLQNQINPGGKSQLKSRKVYTE